MPSKKSASVLVTGGAGFIGSELVRQLVERGLSVFVVDNLANGRKENLEDVLGRGVELLVEDIRELGRWKNVLKEVDVIFHLACLGVRHSLHSPLENHAVNAAATLDLLTAAREERVSRFVYVSSSEVYGSARTVPMTENHPTFPQTVYGASKLAGEAYAKAFFEAYRYPTVVVRPFNTYGPRSHHEGDSGEVIPKFFVRCWAGSPMVVFGDGRQTRDFTFVSDTAAGILEAGFREQAVGQTLNLGSGKEIQIRDLAETIRKVTGHANAPIIYDQARPGDVMRLCADSSKAKEILRFQPKISIEEGLKRLWSWYQNSGRSPQDLLQEEILRNWQPEKVRADE